MYFHISTAQLQLNYCWHVYFKMGNQIPIKQKPRYLGTTPNTKTPVFCVSGAKIIIHSTCVRTPTITTLLLVKIIQNWSSHCAKSVGYWSVNQKQGQGGQGSLMYVGSERSTGVKNTQCTGALINRGRGNCGSQYESSVPYRTRICCWLHLQSLCFTQF